MLMLVLLFDSVPVMVTSIFSLGPVRVTFISDLLLSESLVTAYIVEFFCFLSGGKSMKTMLVDNINMKRQKLITDLTIIIHLEAPPRYADAPKRIYNLFAPPRSIHVLLCWLRSPGVYAMS